MAKELQRAEIEVDGRTMALVAESVVVKGDISAMEPGDKARYYIQTCQSLGLNPATQPLAPLKLNGKEILYPTRGATDQLAAIHRLHREIIDGPKVIDINGAKVGYCVARATHPNGRTETAIATVPFADPAMLYMKLETKAKRRVTLSILGLGWLDETEVESIPAGAKSPAPPIDLTSAVISPDPRELVELRERLADGDTVGTFDALVAVYDETVGVSSDPDARAAGLRACYAHLEETLGLKGQRVRFKAAIDVLERERAAAKRAARAQAEPAVDVVPALPPALASFYTSAEQIELPGEAVALWIKHRAELATLAPAEREAAWKALCARTEEVGKMKNAKVWLKRAIAEEDARRGGAVENPTRSPDDDGPGGGGAPRPANDAPAEDDPEREAIQAESTGARTEASLRAYLAGKYNHPAVRNAAGAHAADYDLPRARYVAVCAERLQAVTPGGLDDEQAAAIVEQAITAHAARAAARARTVAALEIVNNARKVA